MKTMRTYGLTVSIVFVTVVVFAQQQAPQTPPQPMSFFVTSTSIGNGGNLGGLAGADAHCQKLGSAAGRGNVTWRAYLSTQGPNAVNARDRIGNGPWFNARGARIAQDLADLHGDTLDLARKGNALHRLSALSEKGERIPGVGDTSNQHDILTGTQLDGRAFPAGEDRTCSNWTSAAAGQAMVGHHDRTGNLPSWNSSHVSRGCRQEDLPLSGGNGYLYCFATP